MKNKGFSLLEVMIAVIIIGMIAAMIVPNFRGRVPRAQREEFIQALNGLSNFARQTALLSRKTCKVVFDIAQRKVWIAQETMAKDSAGESLFMPLKSKAIRATYVWQPHFIFQNFIIEGVDELSNYGAGKKTEEVWFFIVPDGLAQELTINIADTKDTINGKARHIGLVMNPFTAEYKVYDEYQK